MKVALISIVLFVTVNSCNNKPTKQVNKIPLLKFYYSNFPYDPIDMEFINLNSVKIHHVSNLIAPSALYDIEESDRQTLDSFIQVLNQNRNNESYIESHPENEIVEEGHNYSFSINVDSINKTIYVSGHTAPKRFYDFSSWANTLKNKLERSK